MTSQIATLAKAPTLGSSTTRGVHAQSPYYWAISPDKDLTFSPIFTSEAGIVGGPVAEYQRLKAVLAEHCASFGRDPGEIMTSAHLRLDPADPKALRGEAEAFAEAGLDLGIVYLPPPHNPTDLETVADVLAGL